MQFLDPNHPMFRNPLVRWATVLVPLAMAGVEAIWGGPGWALIFGAAGIYAFWMLIVKGRDPGN